MTEQAIDTFRASTRKWALGSFGGWLTLLLSIVGVGLVVLLVTWLRNISTRYELTDQRLIIHRGIFLKSTDEIELYRVKDVRVNYSLINQLTGIGTISLTSSDHTTKGRAFVMPFVPKARERREELRHLVDSIRQRRRVRELDIDHEYA